MNQHSTALSGVSIFIASVVVDSRIVDSRIGERSFLEEKVECGEGKDVTDNALIALPKHLESSDESGEEGERRTVR